MSRMRLKLRVSEYVEELTERVKENDDCAGVEVRTERWPAPLHRRLTAGENENRLLETFPKADRTGNMLLAGRTLKLWLEAPRPEDGATPLHLAAERDFHELSARILAGGASVDLLDSHGCTALMVAAKHGSARTIAKLLAAGADTAEARDQSGRQVMHHAAVCRTQAAEDVIAMLGAAGAAVNAHDNHGLTPLMIGSALQATAVVESLLRLGASTQTFDRNGRNVLDHGRASRRYPRELKGAELGDPTTCDSVRYDYWRWDFKGASKLDQDLLQAERAARRRVQAS